MQCLYPTAACTPESTQVPQNVPRILSPDAYLEQHLSTLLWRQAGILPALEGADAGEHDVKQHAQGPAVGCLQWDGGDGGWVGVWGWGGGDALGGG